MGKTEKMAEENVPDDVEYVSEEILNQMAEEQDDEMVDYQGEEEMKVGEAPENDGKKPILEITDLHTSSIFSI